MTVTDLAIRKSMTAIALMVILAILGVAAYVALPRESAPDIKIPYVMVYAPYYGTSPSDMENLVSRKLEQQLKGLSDLEEMTSTSSEGVSTVLLEFTPDVEMSDALQEVRDAVELAKPELPQDVRDDLIVYEISIDDFPIMQVILSGDYDLTRLKSVGEDLQEKLEQIQGVLAVDMTGGAEREIRVDLDPERLEFYGLSIDDVLDAVSLENVTLPGGEIGLGTYEYQVRVPGEFETVDVISGIILNPGASTPVYMRDVADVSFGLKDRDSISRLEGQESITLSVKKRSGENIIRIAEDVHATLARLEPTLPAGSHLKVLADESVYIRDMVTELEDNILSGLILVVAVLFLFLGLGNSLFVAMAIPMSMLISFVVLDALHITLNMVVLFSLILALGMLVDNAIVIVENIFRHRVEGKDPIEAASFGTRQVAAAVIASTLTTLCAFAPMAFWPGIMGEFMKYLPITVIITLSASLLVAMIFNPVLCARFMRVSERARRQRGLGARLMNLGIRSYTPVLRWALAHRALALGGMVGLFVVVFLLFGRFNAGIELFPDVDPTYAYVQIEAPSGTRIEVSERYAHVVEDALAQVPDLTAFVTEVGSGGGGFGSESAPPHLTRLTMEFVESEDRHQSSNQGLEDLRERLADFTGAKLYVEKQEPGPPTGKPVNIEIVGDDFAVLGSLSELIVERIRDIPGLVDVQSNFDRGRPEIQVVPDLEKAARLGLRTMDVARTVRTAIKGEDISEFRMGEDEYDIVVRFQQPSRRFAEDLETMTVFYEGKSIPLTSFADVSFTTGLAAIHRIDGSRVVTVSADVSPGYNGNKLLKQVRTELAGVALPPGYRLGYTGENEDQEEAEAFLSKAFVIALMLILVVLITQFDSITVPLVIMGSVIMSLIGVFVGLMFMRMPFGIIMTGVGVISLAGIVVNNAIVLLDYILQLRRAGMDKIEAILEAGRLRFRPVILTAVTTILGLIPLTTGLSVNFGHLFDGDLAHAVVVGGESSQWWSPMGVAVIWGLAVATFLTLVMVPVMYASIEPTVRAARYLFLGFWFRKAEDQGAERAGGAGRVVATSDSSQE
jgi:multidrug efflux pump